MPTPELVERVARAMWESESWHDPVQDKWDDALEADRERERKQAQAALKAHEDWLAEQGLVVALRTGKATIRGDKVTILSAALQDRGE